MSAIVAHILADGQTPDWTNLAQYGILGIVLLLIIFGKLVPGYILERKDKEADLREQRVASLEEKIQERIIPAILECNRLMAEVVKVLDDVRWRRPDEPAPKRRG